MFTSVRTRVRLLVALVAMATLAACGSSGGGGATSAADGSKADTSPIDIAFVGELSGNPSFATVGNAARAGALTAVKQINDEGGIDGRQIRLKTFDTQANATAGAAVIREALASHPDAMTGWLVSTTLAAVVPVLKADPKPVVLGMGLFDGVDDLPFLKTVYVDPALGAKAMFLGLTQVVGGSLEGKRIVLEGISPSVSIDAKIDALKTSITEAGGTVVRTIRDPASITSWSSQAANVASDHPDAIAIVNVDAGASTIAKALEVAGVDAPILADSTANSDKTFDTLASARYYALRDLQPPIEGSPLYKALVAAKVDPAAALASPFFARGYGAVHVLAKVLAKCGVPCATSDFDATIKALGDITPPLNPFFGPLNFTKTASGISTAQLWRYDPATKAPKADGQELKL